MSPIKRKANALWKGDLQSGKGHVSSQSKVLDQTLYSFTNRFEQKEESQTNPEELITSALASCFCMALSKTLGDKGYEPDELYAEATISLNIDDGPQLTEMHLLVTGKVKGIETEDFRLAVEETTQGCPVFKMVAPGLENISVDSRLG